MSLDIGSDALGDWSLQSIFDAAATGSSGVGLGEQKTGDSVPTDAIRSMTPDTGSGGAFSSFWSGIGSALGTVTNTELARYQAKRAVTDASQSGYSPVPATPAKTSVLPWVLLGGFAIVAVVSAIVIVKH
jgi:hypothetical protein